MDNILILQKAIYIGSWLVFPFILYIFWSYKKHKNRLNLFWYGFLFIGALTFIWARFIEPQIITIHHHQIKVGLKAKIVVFSDIHLGIFKKKDFLQRVVKKINQLEGIEAVFIAGDFTYNPETDLNILFADLGKIKVPVYAVLGNHDSQAPGPKIHKALKAALSEQKVIFLHNQVAEFKDFKIIGLGSKWAGEDQLTLLNGYKKEDKILVLLHNPSSTLNYSQQNAQAVNLTLAGHTHGGQIRLPFIYRWILEAGFDGFDKDLHQTPNGAVFVSSGMGEIGLPLRFLIPPVIDVLTLE